MKLKIIFTFFVLCVLKISAFCQLDTFTTCQELDSLAHVYFQENNLDSAIIVIEYARSKFPEQDEYLTMALSFLYNNNKQDSKLLENWDYGLKKRYFFGINDWQYEQFKNNPEFKRLLQMDRQLADSLNKLAHVEYEVILPGDYSKNKTYPILFVFHGNNGNLENSKSVWNSKILKEKFITAHIQSYILMSKDRYQWWLNDEKTNSEFKEIYEQLIKEYPVNQSKVIFTAMSMGGSIAIDYAFNQFVPVYGLVLNCPVVPKISDSLIKKFVDENKKIAIITGEYDWELNNQKELINKVDSLKGNSKININNGLGHEIAKDFSTFLDGYLNWVLE